MKMMFLKNRGEAGTALFTALVFSFILGMGAFSLMQLSSTRVNAAYNRWDYNEVYFHAENVLNWAVQKVADSADPRGEFCASANSIDLTYLNGLGSGSHSAFNNAWVTIQRESSGLNNTYIVTASAKVGGKVRTLQATVQKDAASKVFDYEYFLNNWGWWWGSSITGYGDNRSNWDFDFRGNPTVNGNVIASGQIASDGTPIDPLAATVPIRGSAGTDPVKYLHDGSERLTMPNLKDFTYYSSQALAKGGKLYVGSSLKVDGVHSDTNKPGLYLVGTTANPIVVDGPVVIPGDVVIKGVITGIGTLYVGGNLYVAGDVTYKNGPTYPSPPETLTQAQRDAWVQDAVSSRKDLVSFAVRETILAGQVNSSDWKSACYDAGVYGLKYVGGEASLGADGVLHTPDDGQAYLDTNGDGTPDSAWYDADGDGVQDANYSYASQLKMTDTRAGKIADYPSSHGTTPDDFNSLSSNYFNTLHGVYYCNHAVAARSTKSGFNTFGTLVCRDEAIVFTSTCKFTYDSRIHSRYASDPNKFVDLGLPIADKVLVKNLKEISPVEGFYASN